MNRSGAEFDLHYFYNEPFPNSYAASIQILRTGEAFARLGNRFTLHAGPLQEPESAVLEDYAVASSPCFSLTSFFPHRRLILGAAAQWLASLRFRRLLRSIFRGACGAVVMMRGNGCIELLPELERLKRIGRPFRPLIVYEMHNLAHVREIERQLERSAEPKDLESMRARAMRAAEQRLIDAADAVVCLTAELALTANETFRIRAPILILPSGTDLPAPELQRQEIRYEMVYAGKLEKRKGASLSIEALTGLPDATLGIAGGDFQAQERLRLLAVEKGVADRLRLVGWLPPADVPRFLRSGRVGVCPIRTGVDSVSDRFTSPMKLLQMMALGLPIVASDVAPVRTLAQGGRHALLVPPNNPVAIAAAVKHLLENTTEAGRLGHAARLRAAEFSWENRARSLDAFLRSLEPHRRSPYRFDKWPNWGREPTGRAALSRARAGMRRGKTLN